MDEMDIPKHREVAFIRFLMDNYQDEVEMERYLVGFGYSTKKAGEYVKMIQEKRCGG